MRITSFLSAALLTLSLPIMAMAQANNTSSPSYQAGIESAQMTYDTFKQHSHRPLKFVEKSFIKQGAADAFNNKPSALSEAEISKINEICPYKKLFPACTSERIENKIKITMNKLFHGSAFSKEEAQKMNYFIGYIYMAPLKEPSKHADLTAFDNGVDAWAPQN